MERERQDMGALSAEIQGFSKRICPGLGCDSFSSPLHLPILLCSFLTPTCTAQRSSTPCCGFPGKMLPCEILGESYPMELSGSTVCLRQSTPADRATLLPLLNTQHDPRDGGVGSRESSWKLGSCLHTWQVL